MELENAYLFGVMDGHGLFGREASGLVKTRLPIVLDSLYKNSATDRDSFILNKDLRSLIFKDSHRKVNIEMRSAAFDALYSGTTSVTVFISGNLLVCANVGDSRAIVGSSVNPISNKWRAQAISVDHKPELPGELERILRSNGRVDTFHGRINKKYRFQWKIYRT